MPVIRRHAASHWPSVSHNLTDNTMRISARLVRVACMVTSRSSRPSTRPPAFDTELLSIQQEWAKANYETPAGGERKKAFDALEKRART